MRSTLFVLVSLYFLSALLGCAVQPSNGAGDDMGIYDRDPPRPTPLIGGAQAPGAPQTPDNRAQNVGDYAANKLVPYAIDAVTGTPIPTDMIEVRWKIPVPFSIVSVPQNLVDDGSAGNPITTPGFNECNPATIRLQIQWGDSNNVYFKDILAGQPINLVGSYVKVRAYVSKRVARASGAWTDPAVPTSGWKGSLSILALEGEAQSIGRPVTTGAISVPGSGDAPTKLIQGFQPGILRTLSGFQTSGADAYVMLFDANQSTAVTYTTGGATNIQNGDVPAYQFLVPSGSDFSLGIPDGLVFQHGMVFAWSSTPGTLTKLDSTAGGLDWVGPWALNYAIEVLSVQPITTITFD